MTADATIVVAIIGTVAAAVGLVYRDLKKDRDFWRDAALKAMHHTDKALDAVASPPDA